MKKFIVILSLLLLLGNLSATDYKRNPVIGGKDHLIFNYDSIGANETLLSGSIGIASYSYFTIWWNVKTVEKYLLFDGDSVITPVPYDIISGKTSNADAMVFGSTIWGDTTGVLNFAEVNGIFQDNESLFVDTVCVGIVNGTLGDIYIIYDNERQTTFTVNVDTIIDITNTARGILKGLQDDGTTGKMVIEDAVNDSAYANNDVIYGHSSHDTADVADDEIKATLPDIIIYPQFSLSNDSCYVFENSDSVIVNDTEMHIRVLNFPYAPFVKIYCYGNLNNPQCLLKVYTYWRY